jgi:hypothetical protein
VIDAPNLDLDLYPLEDNDLINAGQDIGVPGDFGGYACSDGFPGFGAFERQQDSTFGAVQSFLPRQVFLPFVRR